MRTGPADQLNGASFLSDSRTSVDGAHSLRLIAPTPGGGFSGGPCKIDRSLDPLRAVAVSLTQRQPSDPSSLINGTRYSFSVHAKAATEGVVLDLAPSAGWKADGPAVFNLTTDWQKYEVNGTATASTKLSVSSYTLTTGACALEQPRDSPTAQSPLLRHAAPIASI